MHAQFRARKSPCAPVAAAKAGVFVLLATLFVLASAGSALAATFSNPTPASGQTITHSGTQTLKVDVVAGSGQTLGAAGSLVVDGAPPTNVWAAYVVDHWEPYYDGEYGEWYDIPVYDYTRATYTASLLLAQGGHTVTLTVAEAPSGTTSSFTWEFPAENCKGCHADMPAAHSTATTACGICHSVSGPIYVHGSGWGSCSNCHGSSGHGPDRLAAHTYYDLDGNPSEREERACTFCHAPSYPAIPQISAGHNDLAAAHSSVVTPACSECHGTDVAGLHADCATCHDPTAPGGATCMTCHAEKAAPHGTAAKTWNYQSDYYSWGSYPGSGIPGVGGVTLGEGGSASSPNSNATAGGGVHSNYQTTTAKCAICHSVHRARADGVKLLDTATATCAGCHISGSSSVTNVVIAWGTVAAPLAGPHGSASGACATRACHAANPHGVGSSQYGLFNAKLLNAGVDTAVADAASHPASSGVTLALLVGAGQSLSFTGVSDAVRVGYTCNQADCHVQTMLAVVQSGWAEDREVIYGDDVNLSVKTGHISVSAAGSTAFTAASSCAGCHDQVDLTTRSGYTFPHAQRPTNSGAGAQTYLWYNVAGSTTDAASPMVNANMKSFDGACLKCHRTTTSGVGVTY